MLEAMPMTPRCSLGWTTAEAREEGRGGHAVAVAGTLAAIAVYSVFTAAACFAEAVATVAPPVGVVRVANACFSATVAASGFLVPRREAVATVDVSGFSIVEVLANEGDHVTSGQVLARLARLSGDGADAGSAQAGTSVTLKAPAAGSITRSTAVVGATASALQIEPLFRIATGDEIELEVEIPSLHVVEVKPGQAARVQLDNGQEFIGRVRLASAEVDPRTQLGRARISLSGDASLPVGMFGRAAISANRSCGLSVPTSAITYRTGGTRVQVVRDGVIRSVVVQVGLHSDTDTEILSGLQERDVVVANAGGSLREGDKVAPIFADAAR
jgi:HlyD family secretion protein